ncbi:MAG: hypothetical protein OEW11_10670 [Nitrospirota bacterium]|nr:hypothetical protein [Nitrospirota bacterium]
MNAKNAAGVHWSFRVIGGVALIWNGMGGINFFAQMNADVVASMPDAYREVIHGRPVWATAAFAVAVFGGTLGCVLLLLRKSAARRVFIASLLGVMVTMAHALGMTRSTIDFRPVWTGTSMSLVVAVFLVWYSKYAGRRGWIR